MKFFTFATPLPGLIYHLVYLCIVIFILLYVSKLHIVETFVRTNHTFSSYDSYDEFSFAVYNEI